MDAARRRLIGNLIGTIPTAAASLYALPAMAQARSKPATSKPATSHTATSRPHTTLDVATSPALSLSLGTCHDGELVGGVELPRRARGLHRLSVVGKRFSGWGTRRTVDFVLRLAARLADLPDHAGVPMRVGNLSTQRGGRIRWSHSHRSGRDIDIAFFAIGKSGKARAPDRFLRFDGNGEARWRR